MAEAHVERRLKMHRQSTLEIDNKNKLDTMTKLLDSSTSQIMTWHNQAYVAATASLGLLLALTKMWHDTQHKSWPGLAVFEVGIAAFTILAYRYLKAAERNYHGNWEVKVKCQYALRLEDQGAYLEKERFFWAPEGKDRGMPSHDIRDLKYASVIVGLILAAVCLWGYWDPHLWAGVH